MNTNVEDTAKELEKENALTEQEEEETAEVEAEDLDESLAVAAAAGMPGLTPEQIAEMQKKQEDIERRALLKVKEDIKAYKDEITGRVQKVERNDEERKEQFDRLLGVLSEANKPESEKTPEGPPQPQDVPAGGPEAPARRTHADAWKNRHGKRG